MGTEAERLQNLHSYDILDSEYEEQFEKLVKLASLICETPMALISLVDEKRQWFKAKVGPLEGNETPRDVAFCDYTIRGKEVLEVKDTTSDERFCQHPFVVNDPHIRFYAGAPLTSPEGHNLGTLCVVDKKPHQLQPEQLEALKILSQQIVELIVLRKRNRELAEAKKLLEEHQSLVVEKARLQTLGEIAAGVCHQINNPLAIIVGRSMILRSLLGSMNEDKTLLNELDVIDHTCHRIAGILKALRSYAKDLGSDKKEVNLREIIEETLTLLHTRILGHKIQLSYEEGSPVSVMVNRNQISQVFLDLMNNAIEAMEESQIRNLQISITTDGNNVSVKVMDTGKGLREDEVRRIFDPFFTTKNRHFGVGLSNAKAFASQNKGELLLKRSKNPTTFEIILPKRP